MMPSIFGENLFDDWMDFPFEKDFLRKESAVRKTRKKYDEDRCA